MRNAKLTYAAHLALWAHWDQVDKNGVAYTEHLFSVMCTVPENCRVVAVLHDIIEDQGDKVNYEVIRERVPGITEDEIRAIELLTRDPKKDTHAEYVKRIAKDRTKAGIIAHFVKVADVRDNMRPERKIPGSEGESMMKRHNKSLEILFNKDGS